MTRAAGEQLTLFPGPRPKSRQTAEQHRARGDLAEARTHGLKKRHAAKLAHYQEAA